MNKPVFPPSPAWTVRERDASAWQGTRHPDADTGVAHAAAELALARLVQPPAVLARQAGCSDAEASFLLTTGGHNAGVVAPPGSVGRAVHRSGALAAGNPDP